MRGIEADRREHRQQFVEKVAARPFELRVVPGVARVEVDAFLFERGQHGFVQHRVLAMHEPLRALDDEIVSVLQRHAVGRQRTGIVADLFLQARHPHLEEFVEVAAGDADEAQALEQRHLRVGGLGQHTLVETEDAEFTIE